MERPKMNLIPTFIPNEQSTVPETSDLLKHEIDYFVVPVKVFTIADEQPHVYNPNEFKEDEVIRDGLIGKFTNIVGKQYFK